MKILINAQYYKPEDVAAAVWIPQLAEDLVSKGHQVTILTAFPNYPKRVVFDGYKNKIFQRETIDGVEVIRTWIYANPSNAYWSRLLNWGSFCISSLLGGVYSRVKPDVIYGILPPLPLGLVSLLLGKITGAKVINSIQDIYPLIAIELGILKNSSIIRFFQKIECFIYKKSDGLIGLSEGFVQHICTNGATKNKVWAIPNWADSDIIKPMSRNTELRNEIGANDKLIVLYSGNMSHNSCTESIVMSANKLKNSSICFLMVGDGVKKAELQKYVADNGIENVVFIPFQPLDRYPDVLATGDIGIVTLNDAATLSSVPSKIFKHMASGRPIIAITKGNNELERMVKEYNIGLVVDPDDIDGIAQAILTLSSDNELRDRLGRNARTALQSTFSREICIDQIDKVINQVYYNKFA